MSSSFITISALRRRLQEGSLSAETAAKEALAALRAAENLNACITLADDSALTAAREVDRRRSAGEKMGPLAGIPIAIKDNIAISDLRCTAGSKMLENFISPYDAAVVEKLKAAGAVMVAKTNMDEFAAGSTGELSAFGPVVNPRYPDRVCGGSSSGSTVAIACGAVPAALGSDTGGSVRLPAACCGVVGLKPTYGAVSRLGLTAHAGSLDQIGPIGSTVEDVALLYDAICGYDPRDSMSADRDYPVTAEALDAGEKKIRIGIPEECWNDALDPALREVLRAALDRLVADGAELVPLHLPHFKHGVAAYNILSTAEFATSLGRYDGVRYGYRAEGAQTIDELFERSRGEGFGDEVKRRILLGNFVLSGEQFTPYYTQAQKMRRLIVEDFSKAFARCDLIALSTLLGAPMGRSDGTQDPTALRFNNTYTAAANLAGLPALSLPVGEFGSMPASLQLIAPAFQELPLLQLAHRLERLCSA